MRQAFVDRIVWLVFALIVAACLLFAAPAFWMFYPIMFVQSMAISFIFAAMSTMVANRVSAQEQGQLAGVSAAIRGLVAALGPLWAGLAYDRIMPGAPLWIGTLLFLLAGLLLTRVRGAQLERSGWDGSLAAGVTLVSPWAEQLTRALARGVRLGEQDAYWQDWQTEYRGGDITCYYEPSEADVAGRPYLLTTVGLQFTVPSAELPEPPATSADLLSAGQQAVAVVVAELNRIVSPVLAAGLGPTSPAGGRAW